MAVMCRSGLLIQTLNVINIVVNISVNIAITYEHVQIYFMHSRSCEIQLHSGTCVVRSYHSNMNALV